MANRIKLLPNIGANMAHYDFSVMLGDTTENSDKLRPSDAGKAMKFATGLPDSRMVPCADGDEISGQLITVEASQTSAGFRVGTVRFIDSPMFDAINSGAEQLVIGDEVVAAAQAAYGEPNAPEPYHVRMRVKKAPAWDRETDPIPPQRLKVVAFQSGTGTTGSVLSLSRIMH